MTALRDRLLAAADSGDSDRGTSELLREAAAALASPPAGEVVAWSVFDKRSGRHWFTHESRHVALGYSDRYSHKEADGSQSHVVVPLYTSPPAVPGWKMVPVEATDAMKESGMEASPMWQVPGTGKRVGASTDECAEIYAAMLSASPPMPQAASGNGGGK